MENKIKYVYSTLLAKEWRKLANFYIDVFQCQPRSDEFNFSGKWLAGLTELKNAGISGIQLVLPGYEDGPAIEIISYDQTSLRKHDIIPNLQGVTSLVFHVDSVDNILRKALAHGGQQLGATVTEDTDNLGKFSAAYIRDPEGNIIEVIHFVR
ncbi:VOC family protein [Sporomusa aerivorans]|uniref:VOC family protein n=1 Tax=Sporomusa aerivorans TaxID=204936 RepID=UPI00352BAE25